LSTQGIEDKASGASMMSFVNISAALLAVIFMGYLPGSILTTLIITLLLFWLLAVFMARVGASVS
jgi:MFS transporter, DHA1 family, multidrug resistance protein